MLDLSIGDGFFDNCHFLLSCLGLWCWISGTFSRGGRRNHFNLFGVFVRNLPNGDLRQAESALTCGQVLAVTRESHALKGPGCAWRKEFHLLGVSWRVYYKSGPRQIAHIPVDWVHLEWIGSFARSSDNFFKLQLFQVVLAFNRWIEFRPLLDLIGVVWKASQLLQLLDWLFNFFHHFTCRYCWLFLNAIFLVERKLSETKDL